MAGLFDEQDRSVNTPVGMTLEQLVSLRDVVLAGDMATAKMWLLAAVTQAKSDIRNGVTISGIVGPSQPCPNCGYRTISISQ